MWKWIIPVATAIGALVLRWKDVMYFLDWCRGKYDAPVLAVIENEGAICTVDFVARNCPTRSRLSVEASLKRLERRGEIAHLGSGFVTRGHKDSMNLNGPWR
jgi:hypothetical protein